MKQTIIHPMRVFTLTIVPLLLTAVVTLALYNLQIISGDYYYERSRNNIVTQEVIPAARGGIFDRYGRPLVGSRVSHNLAINREKLVESGDPNGWLLKMIEYANELGVEYVDTFPLERKAPFNTISEMSDIQKTRFYKYLDHFKLSALAEDGPKLLEWMRVHYAISDEYTDEDARTVIGVRYELEQQTLFNYAPYYFTEDVSPEYLVLLQEQQFPGISTVAITVPEYYTKYAAHLLGRVGPMNAEEYAVYREQGYSMNTPVGKDGLEAAFEAELHGTDGVRMTTRSQNGAITNIIYSKEPDPGNNIRITVDIELQQVAEQELEATIDSINAGRVAKAIEKGKSADTVQKSLGGAVVVIHIPTGDVLASASYPSYDITTLSRDYDTLKNDPAEPLFNRAIQGRYEPGSTFKIVTAIGALNENVITDGTIIHDEGKFTKLGDDYQPTCSLYPLGSHGDVDIVHAIAESCNYFFYDTGLKMGIEMISKYAFQFGLGSKTGIELSQYERTGIVATKEYKELTFKQNWVAGDTLQASIGQSYNLFTPIQLASYAATVANDGVRYAAHFMKEVKSHDDSTIITQYEPYILSKVDAEERHFATVKQGMAGVAKYGTARSVFGTYPIAVAAKTGTVQFGDDLENNAVFIAYAPADNPEIAVAVVVQKGGTGSGVAAVAKGVFDYYFASSQSTRGLPDDGVLLK